MQDYGHFIILYKYDRMAYNLKPVPPLYFLLYWVKVIPKLISYFQILFVPMKFVYMFLS